MKSGKHTEGSRGIESAEEGELGTRTGRWSKVTAVLSTVLFNFDKRHSETTFLMAKYRVIEHLPF